ncbi:hypothetical protein EMPG_10242 [Blastomyces silverae]|uniref:Uncharacterized protein n=1 Tax=Blastomyces silverae TaxID=2060906 RepID=A0A0H1B4K7_9EURO|nr:hypothetical protein EMPG_10242 [Blastomyces silverae]
MLQPATRIPTAPVTAVTMTTPSTTTTILRPGMEVVRWMVEGAARAVGRKRCPSGRWMLER